MRRRLRCRALKGLCMGFEGARARRCRGRRGGW